MRRIADTNLFIMPAGEPVINPLELLNLKEVKELLDRLPSLFSGSFWTACPSVVRRRCQPAFTLCHGTILVVRIQEPPPSIPLPAPMQSLCQNNVMGIVVNGARRGELYSKYTYYHSYYPDGENEELEEVESQVP